MSANLDLVKAVSFPVLGAAESGRKASSVHSLAAAFSATVSRGRGRGSSADQSRKGYPISPVSSRRSSSVFASFDLKDISFVSKGLRSSGPFVAAGSVVSPP